MSTRLMLGITSLLISTPSPVLAQSVTEAMLVAATCDDLRKTVRLEVRNLGTAVARPAVFLEGHAAELVVRELADTHIVALLPTELGDGAYRVRLRHRGSAWLEAPLVLGIVGPVVVE